ncbi:outer membrane beta-barrel protein [Microbacter margulisiae]|uniref:Outer membrane receptor protein involved in Fe transport n=1 Tax=Microbacter margulisiae TaxID=1350067 RepID=A0A7W5H259_9PORP|nr:outer membrane beta-barrel protein [Microbacter margulisiae]MBB3188343.1 outer membrane receptor protein involved in Fe transport [Microbacter margulisiae]
MNLLLKPFSCKRCLLLLFVFNSLVIWSQVELRGKVVTPNHQGVDFAEIDLLKDSTFVKQALSDTDGTFTIAIKKGRYDLQVRQWGKLLKDTTLLLEHNINIGNIFIDPTQMLHEVVVEGHQNLFERKPDRLVFNVANSIISTGGDALDALRVTPMLQVTDDQISMIAKSNLMVMVDDRVIPLSGQDLISYLKTIPSSSIKSIEVITTPPAKYEAEGNSGIINIVLKKNRTDSWNLNLRGTYTQATYPSGNAGADFNYKKGRMSMYANVTTGAGKNLFQMKNLIYYPDETWILTAPFRGINKYANADMGINYRMSDRWEIGAMYFGTISRDHRGNNSILTTIYNNADNSIKEFMPTTKTSDFYSNLHAVNLNSTIKLDTLGKKITVDLDYFINHSHDSISNWGNSLYPDQSMIPGSYYANMNRNKGKVINYSAKIDVTLPYSWASLDFGGEVSFTNNNNDYIFYDNTTGQPVVDNNQTNTFRYRENIQAAYLSASKKLSKVLSAQAGLRLENTETQGYSQTLNQTNNHNYLKLFPTCYLTYQLGGDKSIALSYSRRINRPAYNDLNPYKSYLNSYDYNEGNPFLLPSFSNNVDFSITTDHFVHDFWYSSFTGDIYTFPFIDPTTQVIRYYPENCIDYYSTGISESFTFNKLWWWNSYNNAVCYYIRKRATIPEAMPLLHKVSGNFTTNNDFMLNKKRTLMFNLGFYYEFPYLAAYNNVDATWYAYAGIKMLLLKEKLILSLTANDLFRTDHAKSTVLSNNIRYTFDNYGDTQYLRLAVSYRFGNKLVRVEKRNVSNEDERERVK